MSIRIEEVDCPLPPPLPAMPQDVRRRQEIEEEIQAVQPVPRNLPYTREQIIEITRFLTLALESELWKRKDLHLHAIHKKDQEGGTPLK